MSSPALKPWREVVEPHPDVSAGRYRQAEFAADLAQVLAGTAGPEYQDPVQFFSRTYITEGLASLLTNAVKRLAGKGGDPVVQLKTAFGGGKTHSMLALFHLAAHKDPSELPGINQILEDASVPSMPATRVAVLVGTALDPTRGVPRPELNGVEVRTLWGELAVQLGGKDAAVDAYDLVAKADETGTAPLSNTLVELLDGFGPAVVLIDELVAYARNLHGRQNLPAGTFGSVLTFVQALTEAARRSQGSLVLASVPESEIEIGGREGQAVLPILEQTFGRLETLWKPVGANEGFEIVRRRLFDEIRHERARDETVNAFSRLYSSSPGVFPPEASEARYEERLRACYPIHPEVFDRLYEGWSVLERFQRTRGVLRLMAAVVHELWSRGDETPLITAGSLPLEQPAVRNELSQYLPEGWNAVIDSEIDGLDSLAMRLDNENPRFGRYQACRRVARSIFLGSAPSVVGQTTRGIEGSRILLGSLYADQRPAVFDDALNGLAGQATHLYSAGDRYWYDLQPNLRRTVEERAARLDPDDDVAPEILRRLKAQRPNSGFAGLHITANSADVPDMDEVRLVILPPAFSHRRGSSDSPASTKAQEILVDRGGVARRFRNTLLFVAGDEEGSSSLDAEARQYLAWDSVVRDTDALNLDAHQRRQATESRSRADSILDARLQEAYSWLLVPTQRNSDAIELSAVSIRGGGSMITRAEHRALHDEALLTGWSPALLLHEMDRFNLWRDEPHASIYRLWEDLASYCYLPRLRDRRVLLQAISDGLGSEDFFGFAFAVSDGQYQGLKFGMGGDPTFDKQAVLVRKEAASAQAESSKRAPTDGGASVGTDVDQGQGGAVQVPTDGASVEAQEATRFYASVTVDPDKLARNLGDIVNEIVVHLKSLPGAQTTVTVDIDIRVQQGIPAPVVQVVQTNAEALRLDDFGFE